jgi:hypothetical protein
VADLVGDVEKALAAAEANAYPIVLKSTAGARFCRFGAKKERRPLFVCR